MSPLRRSLCLLRWRPAVVLLAGIALAVLAQASSVGLLGLSGWFIASCFLSGLDPLSRFVYLTPSGAVRALAVCRILAHYVERLVTHGATLRWLTRLRVRLFLDVSGAGPERVRRLGSAQTLDRAMADAQTVDRVLIGAVLPAALGALGLLAAAAVIAVFSTPAALTLIVAGALTAVLGWRRGGDAERGTGAERGTARSTTVTAVDAWEEMACLGAAQRAREAAAAGLAGLDRTRAAAAHGRSRARLVADVAAGVGTVAVLLVTTRAAPGLALPEATLVALLCAGVLESLGSLPAAREAADDAREAANRVNALAPPAPGPAASPAPSDVPARPAPAGPPDPGSAGADVRVVGLPRAPGSSTARLDLQVAGGQRLVVSGRSGSGKTTLLRALAGELTDRGGPGGEGTVLVAGRPPTALPPGTVVLLAHDEHLFTGTVADNLRLADPAITRERMDDLLADLLLTRSGVTAESPVGVGGRPLSGGEARRVALARAIAARPRLLLLDEPTEGLDPPTARQVLRVLDGLAPATTVVLVMHDKDRAAAGVDAAGLWLESPAPGAAVASTAALTS